MKNINNYSNSFCKLLEVKDSYIRLSLLDQAYSAIDKGIHMGGCMSSVVPMNALYYGGFINFDVEQPTRIGQDRFVLSKGHNIALMASIFSDLGYFSEVHLAGSRAFHSIVNGHPGPILPGFHVSTGPLGQGISAATGYAVAGKGSTDFDVYCLAGDGELQEGIFWEPVMYAGAENLDNLCLIIDANNGQLDNVEQLILPSGHIKQRFESFGWHGIDVDGKEYADVDNAISKFKNGDRSGKPTVIICHTTKGYGGFSNIMNKHKATINEDLYNTETMLQTSRLKSRKASFAAIYNLLSDVEKNELRKIAKNMNFKIVADGTIEHIKPLVKTKKAPILDKKVKYDETQLPVLQIGQDYAAHEIIAQCMKVFATDEKVVSIDCDLSSASGLQNGIGSVDKSRALNVGIAEANMMSMAEAFATLGYNAWNSTFCPFFDWKVLRRTAVGYQERKESIESGEWLSKGHNLDITYLAAAANFDTQVNGATHMGNDDIMVFSEIAHLKIIDTSCPNQLISIMKWIMEGEKGLVYLRIMRAAAPAIYPSDYKFEYGKAYKLKEYENPDMYFIASGRQIHNCLDASKKLEKMGINVNVIDMPSFDEETMLELCDSEKPVIITEQNNGYIYKKCGEALLKNGVSSKSKIIAVNALDSRQEKQFIHSGKLNELQSEFNLTGNKLLELVKELKE